MNKLSTGQGVYFVDAGDALFKYPYLVESKRAEKVEIAEVIIEAYNLMGCQVMNVGANDLAAGYDFIREMADRANFPLISANIYLQGDTLPVFEPSAIVETHGKRLGFVGVTVGDKGQQEFEFGDLVETAQAAIDDIADNADLIFLMGNVDNKTQQKLLQRVSGFDVFIRSKSGALHRKPQIKEGVPVIQIGKQGKYAAALKIRHTDPGTGLMDAKSFADRVAFADKRLESMSKGLEEGVVLEEHYADDPKRLQLIERLRKEKANNEDLIKKLRNSFYLEVTALNENVEESPEIWAITEAYIEEPKPKDQHKGH